MTTKEKIHRLLFNALWQIRYEAHEAKLPKAFHLADLFHNVPLHLTKAEHDDDYEALMQRIRARAEEKGIEKWLDDNIDT